MTTLERLFDLRLAFDHPVTVYAVIAIVIALVVASVLTRILRKTRTIADPTFRELLARTRSWYVLAIIMVGPILLGAAWVVFFFLLLGLFCLREFAQATRLNESRVECFAIVVAILVLFFAVIDHWPGLFAAGQTLGICLIAVAALLRDQPIGYLRRMALAVIGFALFGISLGHLAFFSNDEFFRPILLWILICTEMNDVFAYLCGRMFGKRKLIPNTSPNKTLAGAVGAILLTTALSSLIGHFVFESTSIDRWYHWIALGVLISVSGQCGDLVISSIKRDIGVKDMGTILPGHGGLLDRFDSLLLVAPAVFHYLNYFLADGIGGSQEEFIITRH